MSLRRYVNTAAPVLLSESINDAATELTVGDTSAFPTPPFTLGVDRGTPSEEVMLCTAKTGTTFTVTRGYDQTTAVSHEIGAIVEHTAAAIDYRQAGIRQITTTVRDTLAGVDLWVGRVIYNTTKNKVEMWNGSAWVNLGPAVGHIAPYAGTAAPFGALLCQGQAVSRATYADLFALVGTTFGAGNGSTTFNVPDLQQRFPLGKAAAGTGATLGETGGAIDHTHTGPSHTHTNPSTSSEGSHSHTQGSTSPAGSHTHGNPSTNNASVGHTHQLVYTSTGVSDLVHIAASDVSALGTSSSVRHITGSSPDTDSGTSTSHDHPIGDTDPGGNHSHPNPNTNPNGSHSHTQGATGASGTGDTGSSNPPYIALNYIIYV